MVGCPSSSAPRYTSSATTQAFTLAAAAQSAFIASTENTAPVGLLGLQTKMAFVFGVTSRSSSSRSGVHSAGSRTQGDTGSAPHAPASLGLVMYLGCITTLEPPA